MIECPNCLGPNLIVTLNLSDKDLSIEGNAMAYCKDCEYTEILEHSPTS
jgi:hypothetical protein